MKKRQLLLLVIFLFIFISCNRKKEPIIEVTPIMHKALYDSSSVFYADFKSYPKKMSTLPIGIFDSGTGGFTVLEKLLSLDRYDNISGKEGGDKILDFAGEHFVYLADQANMPYGLYPSEGKSDYLRELVVKDALFLMGDNYYMNAFEENPSGIKLKVKIIVIACNTATAYGYNDIKNMLDISETGVKVIGVINAGVEAALDHLQKQNTDESFAIGVLATAGTISSGAYERTIKEYAAQRGISSPITIINQKGYGFAEAVDGESCFVSKESKDPYPNYKGPRIGTSEEAIDTNKLNLYNFDFADNNMLFSLSDGKYTELQLNSAANYAKFNLVSLIEKHRQSGSKTKIKSIILGCTHYPFLINTLNNVVEDLKKINENGKYPYLEIIADDFVFIDPALYTAMECYNTLRNDSNLAMRITGQKVESFISIPSITVYDHCISHEEKLKYEFKYGRDIGSEDITTKQVPFSKTNIDNQILKRIETMLPYSFSLIYPTIY